MSVKEYSNGEVTIVWEASKCLHAGICVQKLPSVYNPSERPWIKAEKASTKAIIDQVFACPSGALSIKENQPTKIVREDDGKKGRFAIYENGILAGEMTYTWAGEKKFIIDHTGVEPGFERKGYGKKMVYAAVNYAKDNGLSIIPLCPFAKAEFEKNATLGKVLK
ncbi:MAG: GNAT family N-acetyltransferase [Bacteroidetes bacterium]|nr:MAG: GNAT family N-acetyltransferase [Bacteroidota bacterium]